MILCTCIVGTIQMQFFAKTSDKLNLKWCQIRLRGRGLMSPMRSPTAEEDVLFVIALYATSSGLSLQVLNAQWVVLGIFFILNKKFLLQMFVMHIVKCTFF